MFVDVVGLWSGASTGGLVSDKLSGVVPTVTAALEGNVASTPLPGVVRSGMGLLNASRNAGVPNVSVSAMPRTYREDRLASILIWSKFLLLGVVYRHTPSPKQLSQYRSPSSFAFS